MQQLVDTEYIDMYDINQENFWIAIEHISRYSYATWFCKKRNYNRVLDIACSNGYGTKMLSKSADKIIGADINASLLEFAKKNHDKNTSFVLADIDNDDLKSNFNNEIFDLIVCFETLEHINNPQKLLKDLKNMLHSNGRILLSIPNSDCEPVCENGNPINEHHKHVFYPQVIDELLKESNLEVEFMLGQGTINKLMRKHNAYCCRNKDIAHKTSSNFIITQESIDYYVQMFGYPQKDDLENSYALTYLLKHKK